MQLKLTFPKTDKQYLYFLIFYQLLLVIIIFAFFYFNGGWDSKLIYSKLINWDSRHYLDIASRGYSIEAKNYLIVFFPLYPLLIRLLNLFAIPYLLAGLFISFVSSIIGHYYFIKLMQFHSLDKKIIDKSLGLLLLSPIMLYFSIIYTEPLFFMLTILFFYFLTKKKFLVSSIIALLASLTRIMGVTLFIPYIISLWPKNNNLKIIIKETKIQLFGVLIISIGLLTYLIINQIFYNHPFYFSQIQKQKFSKTIINPITNIKNNIGYLTNDIKARNFNTHTLDQITTLAIPILLFIYLLKPSKNIPKYWLIWILIQWLIISSQSFWQSNARYLGIIFPIYIILAQLTAKNKYLYALTLLTLFISGIAIINLYSKGYWAL